MRQLNFGVLLFGVFLVLYLSECQPEFEPRAPELVEAVCHVEAKVQRSRWEYLTVCTDGVTTLYHFSGSVSEQVLLDRVKVVADSLAGTVRN